MSIYGYIRVSSQKQTVEHQRYEIKQFAKMAVLGGIYSLRSPFGPPNGVDYAFRFIRTSGLIHTPFPPIKNAAINATLFIGRNGGI